MKNLILIAFSFLTLQTFAQPANKERRKGKIERMKSMSAEDMAAIGTKKMTLNLDLSEDQQAKVQAILLEEAKFRKQKIDEREERKENIEALRPTKEERLDMKKEKLDHQIAVMRKMKSILSEKQYINWKNEMKDRRSNRKEKHHKGRK